MYKILLYVHGKNSQGGKPVRTYAGVEKESLQYGPNTISFTTAEDKRVFTNLLYVVEEE